MTETTEITRPEDIMEFPDKIPKAVIAKMREKALTAGEGIIFLDKTPEGDNDTSGRMYWMVRTIGDRLLLQLPQKTTDGKVTLPIYREYNPKSGEQINRIAA